MQVVVLWAGQWMDTCETSKLAALKAKEEALEVERCLGLRRLYKAVAVAEEQAFESDRKMRMLLQAKVPPKVCHDKVVHRYISSVSTVIIFFLPHCRWYFHRHRWKIKMMKGKHVKWRRS